MRTIMVRYKTRPDKAEENEQLVKKVFEELNADAPEGVRYATFRLADGVSFVHVASIDRADGRNPIAEKSCVQNLSGGDQGPLRRAAGDDGDDPGRFLQFVRLGIPSRPRQGPESER